MRKKEVELIPCECGCGELIRKRSKSGNLRRFKNLHQNRGVNNSKYNNGAYYNTSGYRCVRAPDNHPHAMKNGFIFEHRLVMEKYLGRYLAKYELVHHKNEIRNDNRIVNLQVMTQSQHKTLHNKLNRLSPVRSVRNNLDTT